MEQPRKKYQDACRWQSAKEKEEQTLSDKANEKVRESKKKLI